MYHELTKKEIRGFIKEFMNPFDDYTKKITHISRIEYKGITEYLINHQYLLRVKSSKK